MGHGPFGFCTGTRNKYCSITGRSQNFSFYPSITSTGLIRAYNSLETDKRFKEKRRKKGDRKKKGENRRRLKKFRELEKDFEEDFARPEMVF
jgi:hypothetical protein